MKRKFQWSSTLLAGVLLVAPTGWGQSSTSTSTTKTKTTTHRKSAASSTPTLAQQIKELQTELQQERQQNQQMMQDMQQKQDALQQQLQQIQSAASDASNKATQAQSTASDTQNSVSKLQSDVSGMQSTVADVKTNTATLVTSTQDEQKKMSELKSTLDRFHFAGDVRVRGEGFFQPGQVDRDRARIRLRFGVEGNPNDDFTAGFYIASGLIANSNSAAGNVGSLSDPVSTNDTLSNFFEKKAIGFDRGWITYHPSYAKWLSLTGGKFAYNFPRTEISFDPDLNPEGFNEKFSFDGKKGSSFQNFQFGALQLLFNEVAGGVTGSGTSTVVNRGVDGNAVGGYLQTTWKFGPWKTTPSYTLLNWNGADAIAQAVSPVGLCSGTTTTGCIMQPNTPAAGTPLPNPVIATAATLNTNSMTNATHIVGTGTKQTRAFVSGFEYSDFIWDNTVDTPWKRFPFNFKAEYEQNLRAKLNIGFSPSVQDKAYYFDASMGQQKNKHDLQVGYSWWRVEQDAVISAFVQDDQRTPTNALQNRVYLDWMATHNTQFIVTDWIGRTLNDALQNALKAPNTPKGAPEAYLNRLQFDVIYKF